MTVAEESEVVNQVALTGRLTSTPELRELPSGDPLVTFRVSVGRSADRVTGEVRRRSDWFDCAVWSGRVRRSALSWEEGDTVAIVGELRRRFFRSGTVTQTRVEVEVLSGRRLRRAANADRQQSGRAPCV